MLLVDSHAHLDGERYDADRDQVLARARETGVQTIVAIGSGTGPGSLDCGIKLAEQHNFIYATVGIHPHEARLAADSDFQELEQLAQTTQGHSGRGNRSRLFLQPLSTRTTAAGFL
jgi:TatD DNase family protein